MFTIYAYHNVSSLSGLLNAIAAMGGANDYRSAIAAVLAIGFIVAAFTYALAPQKLQGWLWLASVTLILTILYVPKSTVQVIDVTDEEAPRMIANVPFGLAMAAGFSSAIGHTLTELSETVFQAIPDPAAALPNELSYQRNGMVFGARLLSKIQESSFSDAAFRTDIINFIGNCVEPDISSGFLNVDQVMRSTNLWATFNHTNPARMTSLTQTGGTTIVQSCDVAYTNLDERMTAQVTLLTKRLATLLHPTPSIDKVARTTAELRAGLETYQLIAAGTDTSSFIRHAALMSAVHEAGNVSAQRVSDSGSLMLSMARTQALVQTNSSFINNAKLAEQALPVIRNVIEGLTFALFPFAVLLMLLSGGKDTLVALKNYASILIWIQLWPPLYAVLNYMTSIYARWDISSAGALADGTFGLTLGTSGAISSAALTNQAVVGYLVWSVPVIAWGALKRMENFGTNVAGALHQLGQTASSGTGTNMSGNVSIGNMSFNQVRGMADSTSPFNSKTQGTDGVTTTSWGGRSPTIDIAGNTAPNHLVITASERDLAMKRAAFQTSLATDKVISTGRSLASSLAGARQFIAGKNHSQSGERSRQEELDYQVGADIGKADAIANRYANGMGVQGSDENRFAVGLALQAKALGTGGGISGSKDLSDVQRKTFDRTYDAASSEDAREYMRALQSASESARKLKSNSATDAKTRAVMSHLADAYSATTSASEKLSEAKTAEASAAATAESGAMVTIDLTAEDPALARWLNDRGQSVDARAPAALGSVRETTASIGAAMAAANSSKTVTPIVKGKPHQVDAESLTKESGHADLNPAPLPENLERKVLEHNSRAQAKVDAADSAHQNGKSSLQDTPAGAEVPGPFREPLKMPETQALPAEMHEAKDRIQGQGEQLKKTVDEQYGKHSFSNSVEKHAEAGKAAAAPELKSAANSLNTLVNYNSSVDEETKRQQTLHPEMSYEKARSVAENKGRFATVVQGIARVVGHVEKAHADVKERNELVAQIQADNPGISEHDAFTQALSIIEDRATGNTKVSQGSAHADGSVTKGKK